MIVKLVYGDDSKTYDLTDEQVSILRVISVHDAYRVAPAKLADSLVKMLLIKRVVPVKLGMYEFTQRGRDVWRKCVEMERREAEKAAGGWK